MEIHSLKTIQPYFNECWEQSKTFEVRLNDRNFKLFDKVILREYDKENDKYSGRELCGTITYILYDYYAIKENHVVFSFVIDEYINNAN